MSDVKNHLDLRSKKTSKKVLSSSESVRNMDIKIAQPKYTLKKVIEPIGATVADAAAQQSEDSSIDDDRRTFLKIAGAAGLGVAAAALFPKNVDAYVTGSTPTSNVVGSKNASNTRINPATEDTLASVKAKTDLFTFDAGSNPANLKVNVAAGSLGVLNVASAAINPATEDTLALMKAKTDQLTFDGSNNLLTATSGGTSVVGLKDSVDNRINPAQDDSVILLRRIVKLMESQATVDAGNRQRITIDSLGTGTAITTTIPVSGTVTATVSSAAISTMAGQNQQMFQDVARNAYANGIRQHLIFT